MPTSPTNWYHDVLGVDERSILSGAMRCDHLQGDTNGDRAQGCGYRDIVGTLLSDDVIL
jgi:hypothetical protein